MDQGHEVKRPMTAHRRRMTTSLLAATLLVLGSAVASATEPAAQSEQNLFSLSAHSEALGGEKALNVTMRETERSADSSVVEVDVISEGGPSAALFLVRGFCGLMLARGQQLAVAEQTSEHPIRFHVAFPEVTPEPEAHGLPRMMLTKSQCAALPK